MMYLLYKCRKLCNYYINAGNYVLTKLMQEMVYLLFKCTPNYKKLTDDVPDSSCMHLQSTNDHPIYLQQQQHRLLRHNRYSHLVFMLLCLAWTTPVI